MEYVNKMRQEVFEVLARARSLHVLEEDRAQSPRSPQEKHASV